MKLFLYILYPVFLFAMGTGIYFAYRDAEGLVDNNYYETGKSFFQSKAAEQKLGIAINRPDTLKQGSNEIRIDVTSHGKPLEDATVRLFTGNLSTTGFDSTIIMRELRPGSYQAIADVPFKGVWLVRIDLEQKPQHFKTSRKWFYDIK